MKKKLILLLLVLWGCMSSFASAFVEIEQGSTPPAYQFQSTSTCPSAVGQSAFATSAVTAPCSDAPVSQRRRSGAWNPWGEEGEGDPSGEGIGQVNTPIGSPMALLLMAMLYLLLRICARMRSNKVTDDSY